MDKQLDKILDELRKEVGKISPNLLPLINKFIESCQGGKRLRGKLVILGYEIGQVHLEGAKAHLRGEILKIAAAYEIMHSAILAHDDIIDQSPTRRGQPSLYKSVGMEQAITLADLGFFLAIKIISEAKFPEKAKNEALKLFSQTMVDTAIGQMLDIQKSLPALSVRQAGGRQGDPLLIMQLKTAKYTVAGPLQLGAMLGGAKEELIRELGEFGESLGVAFQIKDDILDGEVKSVDDAMVKALKYSARAKKIIPKITNDPKMIKLLEELVDYMVGRRK